LQRQSDLKFECLVLIGVALTVDGAEAKAGTCPWFYRQNIEGAKPRGGALPIRVFRGRDDSSISTLYLASNESLLDLYRVLKAWH
jgi:hypothetical protein